MFAAFNQLLGCFPRARSPRATHAVATYVPGLLAETLLLASVCHSEGLLPVSGVITLERLFSMNVWALSDGEWEAFMALLDREGIEAWLVSLAGEG